MAHVAGDGFQALWGQLQTVVKGIAALHVRQILGIGCQQRRLMLANGVGHGHKQRVLALVAEQGQLAAGGFHSLKCFFQFHNMFRF